VRFIFFLNDLRNNLRAKFIPGYCAAIRSAAFWVTGIIDNVTAHGILEKKFFFYLEFTTKHSNSFPLQYNPYMPETFDAHIALSDHICLQNNCLVLKDVLLNQ
jgi:hypothetical protein